MKELYYSPSEGLLFYIAGYINQANVIEHIESLKKHLNKLVEVSDIPKTSINHMDIMVSRRYKHMVVFYGRTNNPPKEALQLENHTMQQWLES